jgi:hypothetical protein
MSYNRHDPESDPNAKLIKAFDTFRVEAQAILFGSFVLLACQIIGQYFAVSFADKFFKVRIHRKYYLNDADDLVGWTSRFSF